MIFFKWKWNFVLCYDLWWSPDKNDEILLLQLFIFMMLFDSLMWKQIYINWCMTNFTIHFSILFVLLLFGIVLQWIPIRQTQIPNTFRSLFIFASIYWFVQSNIQCYNKLESLKRVLCNIKCTHNFQSLSGCWMVLLHVWTTFSLINRFEQFTL